MEIKGGTVPVVLWVLCVLWLVKCNAQTQSELVVITKSIGSIMYMILFKNVKELRKKCLENGGGSLKKPF